MNKRNKRPRCDKTTEQHHHPIVVRNPIFNMAMLLSGLMTLTATFFQHKYFKKLLVTIPLGPFGFGLVGIGIFSGENSSFSRNIRYAEIINRRITGYFVFQNCFSTFQIHRNFI